jgi:hypothetical protein
MAGDEPRRRRTRPFVAGERYVRALATLFETTEEAIRRVAITEYSGFARRHRAHAVTRVDAIHLAISGGEFLGDPELTLHEYYHVLRQWNTGEMTRLRYVAEWIRRGCRYGRICYEVEARDFARRNLPRYRALLARAGTG